MMPRLLIVRHGETALNAARVLQPEDTPLSARGYRQAEATARRAAALAPAALVTSDLPRAAQTAAAIAAATGLAAQPCALLRERNLGVLRGQPYDTLGFDPLALDAAPAGGESLAGFLARVAQAFSLLVALQARCGGTVAVVTHGLVVQALLVRHARSPAGAAPMPHPPQLPNASLSIVGALPPHAVELLGCTAHLQAVDAGALEILQGG